MLESLFGTINRERVLIFIFARNEGYPREVATFFDTDLRSIQNQFEKLEYGGILFSRMIGNTRLYAFNSQYPFLKELQNLLNKALSFYPEDERNRLTMNRRRPRRAGKPL